MLCQGEDRSILICDIDDAITKYIVVPKASLGYVFETESSIISRHLTELGSAL